MGTVYFDTNAFTALWLHPALDERSKLRLRRRLLSRIFHRRPRVVIGPKLISELAPMVLTGRHTALVEFLQRLPDTLYLNQTSIVMREEARAAMAGETPDIFLSKEEREVLLHKVLAIPEMWRDETALLASQKSEFLRQEALSREKAIEFAGRKPDLARLTQVWFKNPDAVVRDWGRDALRLFRAELDLPNDEAMWPDAMRLPTIWAMSSYRTARIYLLNRDDRRIDENDLADWGHYLSAIHADVFVIDDKKFRDIVAECPSPKPKVLGFAEWAEDILGDGRG